MISNHKIQTALDEIKDISRIDLALYTEKGKPVAATFEPEEDLEDAITSFADSMAESQMLSGYHFFKVIVDDEVEYILLTKSQAEDAYMVGRLAVCQIRNLAAAYMEQFDRNNFMQNILLGNSWQIRWNCTYRIGPITKLLNLKSHVCKTVPVFQEQFLFLHA